MYVNWRSQVEHYSEIDEGIVKFGSDVTTTHVEKVLRPIIEKKALNLNADRNNADTHLKAGSSTNPVARYDLRSSKTNAFQRVKEENILAETDGHNRNVEEEMINVLRDLGICANDKRDRGQKPPFVEMNGKVYYYLVEKQPVASVATPKETNAASPKKPASAAEDTIINLLRDLGMSTGDEATPRKSRAATAKNPSAAAFKKTTKK